MSICSLDRVEILVVVVGLVSSRLLALAIGIQIFLQSRWDTLKSNNYLYQISITWTLKLKDFLTRNQLQWCWWKPYVGDFIKVTYWWCWWQHHYVGDYNVKNRSATYQRCHHQTRLQHLSPTTMWPLKTTKYISLFWIKALSSPHRVLNRS